jgi:serine/threonine protein kinase
MNPALTCDEELIRRLPLPLAQLYRRAHNAKTALDRHLTAFYLWEAALKLLASVAVVEYAERPEHDPQLAERLQNLARPALGHWWEFVRRLVPVLADQGDEPFQKVRDLVLGRSRDDLPRAAGLDAALREALEGKGGARATVRLTELFDRLVQYRNKGLGHGAFGQRPAEFYDQMGGAILAGTAEVLGRLDVLAGRRLLYIAEVRQSAGVWLALRYELLGESARRIESLELPRSEAARLPLAERLYLEPGVAGRAAGVSPPMVPLKALHPLLIYEADAGAVEKGSVLFLNARRDKRQTEYLCYTTGREVKRPDLGGEQRELLARVLNMPVDEVQTAQWEARSQAEEPPSETAAGAPRRQLGEFELLSELGRGGMGIVYRALQPSVGRQVALKCLSSLGNPRAEVRFKREIRALGRAEHPHLVKVFTSGSDGQHWFYAMELIDGAPLAAVCEKLQSHTPNPAGVDPKTWQEALSTACEETRKAEKPIHEAAEYARMGRAPAEHQLPAALAGGSYVARIIELVRQVAEAAHALHEVGVIHRDIKPGNIIVSADGTQAVLVDLGVAQLADEADGKLTRTREWVGTLRYASPEQVLSVDAVDRRCDVYSLGVTLWELLTLRPMYGATEKTPQAEVIKRIQFEEPERVRKHNPSVPSDLEAVVMKCLEKNPDRRYGSARDLAEDLGRWLEGKAVRARPRTIRYAVGKYVRRRKVGIAIVMAWIATLSVAYIFGKYILSSDPGSLSPPDFDLGMIHQTEPIPEPVREVAEERLSNAGSLSGVLRNPPANARFDVLKELETFTVSEDRALKPGPNEFIFEEVNPFYQARPTKLRITMFAQRLVRHLSPLSLTTVELNEKKIDLGAMAVEGTALQTPVLRTVLQPHGNKIRVLLANQGTEPLPATVHVAWQDDFQQIDLHVLALEVSQHGEKSVSLKWADRNASWFVEDMKHSQGKLFRKVVVARERLPDGPALKGLLLNEKAENVTIVQELRGLWKHIREYDLAIFFFSGHGLTREANGNDYHYLAYDYALAWEEMKRYLVHMPCRVVVILDTCHSGATGMVQARGNPKREFEEAIEKAMLEFAKPRRGIAILASLLGSQKSLENPQQRRHVVFSASLAECLRGTRIIAKSPGSPLLPGEEQKSLVTLADLYRYAERRVQDQGGNDQVVLLKTLGDIDPKQIPLGVIDPAQAVPPPAAPGAVR